MATLRSLLLEELGSRTAVAKVFAMRKATVQVVAMELILVAVLMLWAC